MGLEVARGRNSRKWRVKRDGVLAAALAPMYPSSEVHSREVKMWAARAVFKSTHQYHHMDILDDFDCNLNIVLMAGRRPSGRSDVWSLACHRISIQSFGSHDFGSCWEHPEHQQVWLEELHHHPLYRTSNGMPLYHLFVLSSSLCISILCKLKMILQLVLQSWQMSRECLICEMGLFQSSRHSLPVYESLYPRGFRDSACSIPESVHVE